MGEHCVIGLMIWACSLLLVCGCDVTLGPKVEKKGIVVKSGTGIEVLKNVTVPGKVMSPNPDGEYDEIQQDIGGWITMHPDHWDTVKRNIKDLRAAYRALKARHGEALSESELRMLGNEKP